MATIGTRIAGDPKDVLREMPLFAGCTAKELARADSLLCHVSIAEVEVMCREGETGEQVFLIAAGEAFVSIRGQAIATLGPGSFCGELALLDGAPRVASVTAATDVLAFVATRREFSALLNEIPAIAHRMMTTIGNRLRLADRAFSGAPDAFDSEG
jgi:CRP/FNR family transcriptional regulator, cyclic AMP receptor protein